MQSRLGKQADGQTVVNESWFETKLASRRRYLSARDRSSHASERDFTVCSTSLVNTGVIIESVNFDIAIPPNFINYLETCAAASLIPCCDGKGFALCFTGCNTQSSCKNDSVQVWKEQCLPHGIVFCHGAVGYGRPLRQPRLRARHSVEDGREEPWKPCSKIFQRDLSSGMLLK